MPQLMDEQLAELARKETDSAAAAALLNELFSRHHSRVASWCLRFANNADQATDLAQEIFLKAFQRINTFQGQSKFTTWLYVIARNHCLDYLRSLRTQPESEPESLLEELPDLRAASISSSLQHQQAEELLRSLMRDSLDETEHQVLTLHYVEELPLATISNMLSLTNQSGAKAYVVSARRKLKRAYERWAARQGLQSK